MGTTLQQKALNPSSPVSIVSSGSSLSSGNNAITSGIDFSQSNANIAGYARGRWIFSGTFASTPGVPSAISIYALVSSDNGTTYDTDPGRSTRPVSPPIAVIPLDGNGATQQHSSAPADLPVENCKIIAMNDGTGQTLNSGWSLSLIPETDQDN